MFSGFEDPHEKNSQMVFSTTVATDSRWNSERCLRYDREITDEMVTVISTLDRVFIRADMGDGLIYWIFQ